MPIRGINRKPATIDPKAAPTVFTKVNIPAATCEEWKELRIFAPAKVKNAPEKKATGKISGTLIQRICFIVTMGTISNGR